jgi:hypothetical protein
VRSSKWGWQQKPLIDHTKPHRIHVHEHGRRAMAPPPRPLHDARCRAEIRIELVGRPRCLSTDKPACLADRRILIVVMALWLPVQTMAAVGMGFCQQMPQGDAPIGTQTVDIPSCNQTNPGILQSCRLCHSCIVCPMPTLGADHPILFLLPPLSFESVALWQPYARALDVIEHPPRPLLALSS